MTDEKLNIFYQQIANTVIEMIPEKWTLVKLYAEMWNDFSTIYFYYFPDNGAEPVNSLSIPRLFEVDRDEYTRLKRTLRKQIEQLQDEFMASGQEPWTTLPSSCIQTANSRSTAVTKSYPIWIPSRSASVGKPGIFSDKGGVGDRYAG